MAEGSEQIGQIQYFLTGIEPPPPGDDMGNARLLKGPRVDMQVCTASHQNRGLDPSMSLDCWQVLVPESFREQCSLSTQSVGRQLACCWLPCAANLLLSSLIITQPEEVNDSWRSSRA